jgi:hypothetical protein
MVKHQFIIPASIPAIVPTMRRSAVIRSSRCLVLLGLTLATLSACVVIPAPPPPPRPPVRTTPAPAPVPAPAPLPPVAAEASLDKNEVIIDKPAPLQTDRASLLAPISPAQQSRIAQALKDGNTDPKAQANINQATPKMRAFIERLSCIKQYNDGGTAVLQPMAAPGASFQYFVPPMHGTKVHNKSTCLTVSSVQVRPVTIQGAAALQIKVSFLAEDSGETTTSNHEINKNSKGIWWFTR